MTKPNELYPPVTMPTFPPTWEDVVLLALHYPIVRQAVGMVERGDWTREQALIMAVYALATEFRRLFSAEVERRDLTIQKHFAVIDPR